MAKVKKTLFAYLTERNRCRSIADLESLPRSILRDIGIRRGEIPLVIDNAIEQRRDHTTQKPKPPPSEDLFEVGTVDTVSPGGAT